VLRDIALTGLGGVIKPKNQLFRSLPSSVKRHQIKGMGGANPIFGIDGEWTQLMPPFQGLGSRYLLNSQGFHPVLRDFALSGLDEINTYNQLVRN
jgi:hypothetical protein